MSTNRKGLLNKFPTVATFLCRETGIDLNNLVSSTFSLNSENIEELSPSSIENGFRQMMVLDHVVDKECRFHPHV